MTHELVHALHGMCGNRFQACIGRAPNKADAASGRAVEEFFTVGAGPGEFIQNPLTENGYRMARDLPIRSHYGDNAGNNLHKQWLRNSGDEDPASWELKATGKHHYMQLPRTSPSKLACHEAEADRRWIDAFEQLGWVRYAESTLAATTHADSPVLPRRSTPGGKHAFQECIFAECLRLYKDGRYAAAHHIASRFPPDMLQHRGTVVAAEARRFADRVSLRYTEQTQRQWSAIHFGNYQRSISSQYYRWAKAIYDEKRSPAERTARLATLKANLEASLRMRHDAFNRRGLIGVIAKGARFLEKWSYEELANVQADVRANIDKIDAMLASQADRSERIPALDEG